ncbi:MAG: phosphatase PAP2 family protein [Proteobacteria bacterium]|nr:phosphatase PAP2 family protein [Pseudomonadota bacterium]
MSKKLFYIIATITVLVSVLLFIFPRIDLAISHFFYLPNGHFLLASTPEQIHILNILRNSLVDASFVFMGIILLIFIYGMVFKKHPKNFSPRNCAFILICFFLIPGLFINGILKNYWGRARPFQIQEFGGDKQFTPAWVISNQCQKNCSFTSGETANIFCYLALLFLIKRKKWAFASVMLMGLFISFERIAQGEHFFSDTLLSALLDYLSIWLIYHLLRIGEKNDCDFRKQLI